MNLIDEHARAKIFEECVAENIALRADNERLRAFAIAHEAWEADLIINHPEVWEAPSWLVAEPHYEEFMALQKLRNEAIK